MADEPKFTRLTPWEFHLASEGNRYLIRDSEDSPMAAVYMTNDSAVAMERACLMAAAPEMYESLKTILSGFEEGIFVRNIDGDGKSDWAMKLIPFVAALGRAKAAIAKANGLTHE